MASQKKKTFKALNTAIENLEENCWTSYREVWKSSKKAWSSLDKCSWHKNKIVGGQRGRIKEENKQVDHWHEEDWNK